MPSIHIPEDVWTRLIVKHDGDRVAAREAVKDAARDRAPEPETEGNDE